MCHFCYYHLREDWMLQSLYLIDDENNNINNNVQHLKRLVILVYNDDNMDSLCFDQILS